MMNEPPNKWANSDAKHKLTKMINDKASKIHTTMTFDELYRTKDFCVYKRDNFRRNANRLYEQITGRKKTWPDAKANTTRKTSKAATTTLGVKKSEKKKKVEAWKSSLAKAFLLKLLTDEDAPIKGMKPREVYDSHEVFQQYKYERFRANMKSLVEKVQTENDWAKIDENDLVHDRKLKPRANVTSRGYPFWHTHKAKKLLAEDVKSGKYKALPSLNLLHFKLNFNISIYTGKANKMKPKELWNTKKEYKDFPLDVFRDHIHQEKRFQREGPYWQLKRNKKGMRKHEAHVKELKRGWLGVHNKDKLLVDAMKDLYIK